MKKLTRRLAMAALLGMPVAAMGQGGVVSTFPYSCGFETMPETHMWTLLNSPTNAWCVGTDAHSAGSKSLYISNDEGTTNAYTKTSGAASYACLSLELENTSDYEVSFDWRCYGENNYDFVRVWIVPYETELTGNVLPNGLPATSSSSYSFASATPEGWIDIANGQLSVNGSWRRLTNSFGVETSGTYKLVLMWANDNSVGTNPPAAIDEVRITEVPCRAVSGLTVSEVTAYEATVSWNASLSNPEHYMVYYSTGGNTPNAIQVTGTSATLTGLEPNTVYTVSVVSMCSSEEESNASSIELRTSCAPKTLPFSCDFESDLPGDYYAMPYCWNKLATEVSTYPYVNQYGYGMNNSNALYFYTYNSSYYSTADSLVAVLPQIDIENYPMENNQLVFWVHTSSYSSEMDKIVVGTMSDPTDLSTFVEGRTMIISAPEWAEVKTPLSPQTFTSNPYPAIMVLRRSSGNSSIYIDNVTIREIPECDYPSAFRSVGHTSHSINVAWFNYCTNPTEWLIERTVGGVTDTLRLPDSEMSYTQIDPNITNRLGDMIRYTIDGLEPNTEYTLRLTCISGEDTTQWASSTLRVRTSNIESEILSFEINDDEIYRGSAVINSEAKTVTVPVYYTDNLEDSWGDFTLSDYATMYVDADGSGEYATQINDFYTLTPYLTVNEPLMVRVMAEDGETYTDWELLLEAEACSSPRHLSSVAGRTWIHVAWDNPDPAGLGYEAVCSTVELDNDQLEQAEKVETSDLEYRFNGLERTTEYHVYVRTICADGYSSWSSLTDLTVGLSFCDTLTFASGTVNNDFIPMYNNAQDNNYRMQVIYPATMLEDLEGATLRNMIFFPTGSSVGEEGDWAGPYGNSFTLKLAVTTDNNLNTAWSSTTGTTVMTGHIASVNSTDGMVFEFDSPFTYEGGNLLVELQSEHTKKYSDCSFVGVASTGGSRHAYGISYLTDDGIVENFVPKMRTILCVSDTACPVVTDVTFSNIDVHSADLSWTASEGDYATTSKVIVSTTEIIDLDNYAGPIAYEGTETTVALTGLLDYTLYYVYIRANCNDGQGHDDGSSTWVMRELHTASECRIADNIYAKITSPTTATIFWTNTGAELGQTDHFGCFFSDTPLDESTLNADVPHYHASVDSINFTGLVPGQAYYFYIRNHCTEIGTHSPWTDLTFTMYDAMPAVINLHPQSVRHTSAMVVWESDTAKFAHETAWQVAIVTAGATPTDGDWIVVTERHHTFMGLAETTEYDVYVRPYDASTGDYGNSTQITMETSAFPEPCSIFANEELIYPNETYTPIYGYYMDSEQRTQSIYPAEMLSAIEGLTIQSLHYDVNYVYSYYGVLEWDQVEVRLSTTDRTDLNDGLVTEEGTLVYSGGISVSEEEGMTITLDEPFTYSGGNLLVEFYHPVSDYDTWAQVNFDGIEQPGGSLVFYSSYGDYERVGDFLPKMEVCCLIPENNCLGVSNVAAEDITYTTAEISWMPGNEETLWHYAYSTTPLAIGDRGASSIPTTTLSNSLTDLQPDKDYWVYVRPDCGDLWTSYMFATPPQCGLPTLLPPTDITATSVTLTAVPSEVGSPEEYIFLYWVEGEEVQQVVSANTIVVIDGLQPNTIYNFALQTSCGTNGTSRRTVTQTYRTECDIQPIPMVSSFEEDNENTDCWKLVSYNTTNDVTLNETSDGTYLSFTSYDRINDGDYDQYAFSPLFNTDQKTKLTIRYGTMGYDMDFLWFGYTTEENATTDDFIWTDDYYTTEGSSYDPDFHYYQAQLPVGVKQMAIHYYGDWGYYAWIDSVSLEPLGAFTVNLSSANPEQGTVEGRTGTLEELTLDTLYANPAEGYHLAYWSDDNGNTLSTDEVYVHTVTGDINIIANFEINEYTVTVMTQPGGASKGSVAGSGTYLHGATATATATANIGYHFTKWNDENTENPRTWEVTGNKVLVAIFDTNEYDITAVAHGTDMGTITGPQKAKHFSSITLTAEALYGYHFVNWTNDLGEELSAESELTLNDISGSMTVYANFSPNLYTVTAVSNDPLRGTVLGGHEVVYLTQVSLSANPVTGYHLTHWSNGETTRVISILTTCDTTLTAYFDTNEYVISARPNNETMGSVYGTTSAKHFTSITLRAEAKTGYQFVNWTDNSGREVESSDTYTIAEITGAVYVTANFVPKRFTINGVSEDPTKGSVRGTSTVIYESPVTLTAHPNPGYQFVQWDNGVEDNPTTVIATSDSTLTALFSIESHTITLTSDNEEMGSVTGSGTYNYGETATITATANYGYHFTHWSNGSTVSSVSVTVTDSYNLIAYFEPNVYTVTGVSDNTSMGSVVGSDHITYLSSVTLTALPNNGYKFSHWSNGSTESTLSVIATKDTVVTAYFTYEQYTISGVSSNEQQGSVSGTTTADYASIVTLTAEPAEGYHFTAWNDGNTDNPRTVVALTDLTYTASFAINTYTIILNYDATKGSVTNGESQTVTDGMSYSVNHNETLTFTAIAGTGYRFGSWTDGISTYTDNSITYTATRDASLTANFTEAGSALVTLTSNDPTMGTLYGSGSYHLDNEVRITAVPNAHYHFLRWVAVGDESNPITTPSHLFTLTKDTAFEATFARDTHTVALNANATRGSVTGAGRYPYGEIAHITATANSHYHFTSWSDGNSYATRNITVESDITLTANFAIDQHTVTATVNDPAMGSASGSTTANYGTTVTLIATANPGYHFTRWSNGATTESVNITVDRNTTLTAYFEPDRYNVSAVSNNTEMGTVSGSSSAGYHSVVTLIATPNYGYHFTHWSNGETTATINITVAGDTTLTAYFAINQYTVSVNTNATMGTVTGIGSYTYGSTATLTAIANTGYHFVDWSNGNKNETITVTVNEDIILDANFEVNTYTVSATSNNEEMGTVSGAGNIAHFQTATLIATPLPGYNFLHWTNTAGLILSYNRTLIVSPVSDTALVAKFSPNGYTLTTVSDNSEMGTVSDGVTVEYHSLVTITATSNYGYHFTHWSNGSTENPMTIEVTKDSTIIAYFAHNTYTVTGRSDNSLMGTVNGTATVDYLSSVSLTAQPNTGYHFSHWSNGSTENPLSVVANENKTLTAYFEINQYTVTLSAINGTTTGSGTYNYAATATLRATPAAHYHFVSWSDGNNENPRTVTITGDLELSALFEINHFTVSVSSNDITRGTVSGGGIFAYGTTTTLTATAAENYNFVYWNDGNNENPRAIVVNSDINYIAVFDLNRYSITLNCNTVMGSVSGSGSYDYGATVSISATPNAHYHFIGWNDGNNENPREVTVNGNMNYTALFAIDTHHVVLAAENGTVVGSGEYPYGSTITLNATPDEGYHFTNWSDGNTQNPRTITVESDMNLTANFTINEYTLTLLFDEEKGSVTGAGTYHHGESAIISAIPSGYYTFDGWSDDNSENPRTLTVTSDLTLTANFIIDSFDVSISSNTSQGTVAGAGRYAKGTQITLTATPRNHFHFTAWSDGETENPRSITVMEDINLSAFFDYDNITLVISTNNETWGSVTPSVGTHIYHVGDEVTLTATPASGYAFTGWSIEGANFDILGNSAFATLYAAHAGLTIYATATFVSTIGIDDIETASATIRSSGDLIIIEGAENQSISIFDVNGRLIHNNENAPTYLTVETSASGVYFVKIGESPARRVVVVR